MHTLLRDLRYTLRRLRQAPGFTAIVILTLALGIGANTAIFSVVDAVLLRPLPYGDPGQLVTINHFYKSTALNDLVAPVSAIGFRDYRDKTKSFSSMAVQTGWSANLTGAGEPVRVPGSKVSGLYFKTLGVAPELGRVFGTDEDVNGKNRVVVLSDGLWHRAFGGDRDVIHKAVELNGLAYSVIGVMPPQFHEFFTPTTDVWAPLSLDETKLTVNGYTNEYLNLVARVKPGVTVARARAEMAAFATRLKEQYPDQLGGGWTLTVTSLPDLASKSLKPILLILLGAVGFVLLIACANVANLLLARAAARTKEVTIRSALGADRQTLIRQLLTESVILSLAGGVAGLGVAYWSLHSMVSLIAAIKMPGAVRLDGMVLLFTLGVAVVTGIVFGLVPALQISHTNLADALKEGGRGISEDSAGRRVRRTLVVSEMALALTLLVGAGLLIRSVARLESVRPGFDPQNRRVSRDHQLHARAHHLIKLGRDKKKSDGTKRRATKRRATDGMFTAPEAAHD